VRRAQRRVFEREDREELVGGKEGRRGRGGEKTRLAGDGQAVAPDEKGRKG